MTIAKRQDYIKAWQCEDVLLEVYYRAPGAFAPLPKHAHADYQFGFSPDNVGACHYRGTRHPIAIGSLSIIHSGEVHSPRAVRYFHAPATYYMMFVNPTRMQSIAAEIGDRSTVPVFEIPCIRDVGLTHQFLGLHLASATSKLEQQSRLLFTLAQIILRAAQNLPMIQPLRSTRSDVLRVRDYLQDNYAEDVSLEKLAQLNGWSSVHLCRVFCQEIGLPPHAYQIQVRVDRAKALLVKGWSVSKVALEMGFFDQSHFAQHFKRLTGVTPGKYITHMSKHHETD